MDTVPISNPEENYQITWSSSYPILFHGEVEGKNNFVAQIIKWKNDDVFPLWSFGQSLK